MTCRLDSLDFESFAKHWLKALEAPCEPGREALGAVASFDGRTWTIQMAGGRSGSEAAHDALLLCAALMARLPAGCLWAPQWPTMAEALSQSLVFPPNGDSSKPGLAEVPDPDQKVVSLLRKPSPETLDGRHFSGAPAGLAVLLRPLTCGGARDINNTKTLRDAARNLVITSTGMRSGFLIAATARIVQHLLAVLPEAASARFRKNLGEAARTFETSPFDPTTEVFENFLAQSLSQSKEQAASAPAAKTEHENGRS